MLKGIDVSVHNGNIDWNKVKNDNVTFAILRIGYGVQYLPDEQKDSQFENNYSNAKSIGISVGAYYYSYANSIEGAEAEANNCLKYLAGKGLDYPIYYDIEDKKQSDIDKETLTNMINKFCEVIKNAGYKAGLYASTSWLKNKINTNEINYSIWVAQYYKECEFDGKYDIWQYTSSGEVNGITGNVDMNYAYINTENIQPKQEIQNNNNSLNLIPQHGVFTIEVDGLRVRRSPSLNGEIVATYNKGESVGYDYYVDNEGIRWISYIGNSGNRNYIARRKLDNSKIYGICE